jgi:asparagine synthase (glutamine-hydrolysing)
MAGIAGLISPTPRAIDPLLEVMAGSLCLSSRSTVEKWTSWDTGLCRVRSGMDNPEQQPIFNGNKARCIVMFGECFNYANQKQELMHRGHRFLHGDNDAEFCLKLYEEYGHAAFAKLDGSYSLALYDSTSGELLLASDRLGNRPLFYGSTPDGTLFFASQVASILRAPGISRELNIGAAVEFCALQRVYGDRTYHRSVKMLPPASVLRYNAGRVDIKSYWQFDYRPEPGSADEYAEELTAAMKRAARNVARGRAKPAVLLSGGLDSRMVVAAAEDKISCYTFGDYMNLEAQAARCVAEARGFEFHFLQRGPDHYVNMLDMAVDIGNGMYAFNHAHALGFTDAITVECDVIAHGCAIERLFRGTCLPKVGHKILGFNAGKILDPALTETNLPQRILLRGGNLLGKGIRNLLTETGKAALEGVMASSARELTENASAHAENIYDKFMWPDVYYHARRTSALFEYALRPFMTERGLYCNNEVIDLHLKMPFHLRAGNQVWIKVLARLNRKIARTIDANTNHSPYMPAMLASILESGNSLSRHLPLFRRTRKKTAETDARPGLSPTSWPWFDLMICNNAKMRQVLTDTLNDPEALPPDLFDHQSISRLLTEHLAGRGHHRIMLFALLTFGRWHKKYACL